MKSFVSGQNEVYEEIYDFYDEYSVRDVPVFLYAAEN